MKSEGETVPGKIIHQIIYQSIINYFQIAGCGYSPGTC
jgi:hypothetical protein